VTKVRKPNKFGGVGKKKGGKIGGRQLKRRRTGHDTPIDKRGAEVGEEWFASAEPAPLT